MHDSIIDHHPVEHALSRTEFCAKYRLSRWAYYELRRLGRAPDELHLLGKTVRITPQAERDWLAAMAEDKKTEASRLEAARRRKQTKIAGKLAAASDQHISKRRARGKPPPAKREPARR